MSLYAFEGRRPQVAATAFVAPTAALIGDVTLGDGSSVWFHCVLRGDTNFIRIGARTNVQDGTIIHVNTGAEPTIIGHDVTIGHAAIIHACTLHDGAFVGMGALVLDRAVIETGGVLAAGSVLAPGKRIAAGELWMGNPAVMVRMLDEAGRARFARNAAGYAELSERYRCKGALGATIS